MKKLQKKTWVCTICEHLRENQGLQTPVVKEKKDKKNKKTRENNTKMNKEKARTNGMHEGERSLEPVEWMKVSDRSNQWNE